jgi:hypothetical protein
MSSDPFTPIGAGTGNPKTGPAVTGSKPNWVLVCPVPADAPALPARHPELGKPANTWPYIDGDGNALGYVLRFEDRAGGKQFRPLTLWRPAAGGTPQWRWQSWPSPRPLYGLHELAQRPDAPVVVVEGEKACNAARMLLPDFVWPSRRRTARTARPWSIGHRCVAARSIR